jgi:hypothetical protein
VLAVAPAEAQQGGAELRGRVVDQQGATLPGASILVRNQDSGMFREILSNADGSYFVPALIPGMYEISVQLLGFSKFERRNVRLEVGRTTTQDIQLEIGTLEEAVTVTADAPLVDIASNEVGGSIQNRELIDMPSVSRSFTGYLALLPGVVYNISTGSFDADSVTINGQSSRNVNYTLDGGGNNDSFHGSSAGSQARVPIESVQEFQVLTGQFDAEFGNASGGVINAVSKQGTNQFRGSAFGWFKESALTARDYFVRTRNLAKPDTREHQYGGTVGGPVVRDRAHFFVSLEAVPQDRGVTVNIPARPELSSGEVWRTRFWSLLTRFDHQINPNHTWNVRWLRTSTPEYNRVNASTTSAAAAEEHDVDQTLVGSLNSVVNNTQVNTLRLSVTGEDVIAGGAAFFDNGQLQHLLPPTLQYLTFVDQQASGASRRLDTVYGFENVFSWFLPNRAGDHDLKFGVQYSYSTLGMYTWSNENGTFSFSTDRPFNPTDPRTYPERLSIRVPGTSYFLMRGHFVSGFVQDRWRPTGRFTLNLGARYDVEIVPTPARETTEFAAANGYPVDKNNLAPRLGFSYALDNNGQSVLRGGFGIFYQRTPWAFLTGLFSQGVLSDSFTVFFPTTTVDPGPSSGRFPTDPLLVNGSVVNRDQIDQLFPPGTRRRNEGIVLFDNPERRLPHARQVSIGYGRQLWADTAVSVDYIHSEQRDLYALRDLNPALRTSTSRTAPLVRPTPGFAQAVRDIVNVGRIDYDALQLTFEKRYSRGYSYRVAYTRSRGRGNTEQGSNEILTTQLGDDLRLDDAVGPTSIDRPHNLVISGTAEVPRTRGLKLSGILRALSGTPFTLTDSTTDPDRNGFFQEPLPAGTYSGVGPDAITVENKGGLRGARGPGLFQLDLRGGYVFRLADRRTVEAAIEVLNATNRSNFANPGGDRRLPSTFLVRTGLLGGGLPRTVQLSLRYQF